MGKRLLYENIYINLFKSILVSQSNLAMVEQKLFTMQKPLFSGIFGLGISKVIDTVDDNDIENKSTLVQNCSEEAPVPLMGSQRFKRFKVNMGDHCSATWCSFLVEAGLIFFFFN